MVMMTSEPNKHATYTCMGHVPYTFSGIDFNQIHAVKCLNQSFLFSMLLSF